MNVIGTLKDKEKRAIEELQFRTKWALSPALKEDSSLFYRFLKARDFDIDKAEKMLLKHISWRKTYQVDTVLDDFQPREFFHKYAEPTTLGYGKDGEMIIYCATGKLEISDVLKCVTMNEYMKSWVWYTERNLKLLKEESEKTGKNCSQMTFIIDLENLTLSNAADKSNAEVWLKLTYLFQDNYPERMKAVYVINAPSYYVLVYSVLKAVMSGAMLQKVHVLGTSGYQEKLLDLIDADLLPAFLGGNRTDPDGDPRCASSICHCGRIPSDYHLLPEDRSFKDKSQVQKLVIPKKSKEEINIDITEENSLIKWEFLIKNRDIYFGLNLKVSEQNVKEILPMEKYATADGTEVGAYKCQTSGKYSIIFDNTQSWWTSKEVEYCITVIKP